MLRQVLDDDVDMVVEDLDGRVVVLVPGPDEELGAVDGEGPQPDDVVTVHRQIEDDEEIFRMIASDPQLVWQDA